MTWSHAPDVVADDPVDHARLARNLRGLHHAARPAPSHRRRSLRPDAGEPGPAPRRLVGHLLPPRRCFRDRLRQDAPRQRRRGSVPAAAATSGSTTPRRAPRTSCCGSTGCPGSHRLAFGPHAVGRARGSLHARGRGRPADGGQLGDACAARSTTSGTEAVLAKLGRQAADAAAWRDKCLLYFQQFSKRPLAGRPAMAR